MRWVVGALIAVVAVIERAMGAPDALVALFVIGAATALLAAARRVRSAARVAVPLVGARWADRTDAVRLASPGAFLLGLWGPSKTPLYLNGEQLSGHVLVVGPSRTGKTAGVIAPNLLCRDPLRESIVVLDIKTGPRSLWNVTAGRYGTRARLFCPFFEGSVG